MILGVIEGQIRGGYFPDCILDPSVVDPSEHSLLSGPFWYRNISDFLDLVGNFRISVVLLGILVVLLEIF